MKNALKYMINNKENRLIAIGMIFVIAIGAVGAADFDDEVQQGEYHCEMFEQGHWPDPGYCEERGEAK